MSIKCFFKAVGKIEGLIILIFNQIIGDMNAGEKFA
jgi:hypothetical protein